MSMRQRLVAWWQAFLAWQRHNRAAHARGGTQGNCCANPANVYAARRRKE